MVVWITLNVVAVNLRWDPYPFILLNLAFSTQAAYAAPLILLAQNRQADRDRVQAEEDRARAASIRADTEYLARELASLRVAVGELATRDFIRGELSRLTEDDDDGEKREKKAKKKRDAAALTAGRPHGIGAATTGRCAPPAWTSSRCAVDHAAEAAQRARRRPAAHLHGRRAGDGGRAARAGTARQAAGRSPDGSQTWRELDAPPPRHRRAGRHRPGDGDRRTPPTSRGSSPCPTSDGATPGRRPLAGAGAAPGRRRPRFSAYIHPDHIASAGVARALGLAPTSTVVDGEIRLDRRLRTVGRPALRSRRASAPGMETDDEQDAHRGALPDRPADRWSARTARWSGWPCRHRRARPGRARRAVRRGRSPTSVRQLGEYFAGERTAFDLPLRPVGSDFELARVGPADARSPTARPAPTATSPRRSANRAARRPWARRTGATRSPIVVPCHRVIGADGSLVGFGGGLPRKRFLLDLEQRGDRLF